ncbi:hypothetical protein [Nesterenkonia sp. NBAIMH1]|nr:hypothetical protein [Nesterenkonia sp. NBAIMH1]
MLTLIVAYEKPSELIPMQEREEHRLQRMRSAQHSPAEQGTRGDD